MKKISVLLVIALLLNIAFSVTSFAKNEKTEALQLNNFINYAEEDGVLPSGWANNDNNAENTMLKMADSENEGEKCLSFDCTSKTGRINGKNFTNQTSGKILIESRVFFTKKSGLSLSFTGTSDAVRPGVTLYQDGLDDGQWHDMRIVIDITNGTISIGYDGDEPVVKAQNITFTYGVQRFYFANWSTSNSVVSFQYLNVYKYYTEAMPVKFEGRTVLNERVDSFSDGDTVKSGINRLNITFDANLANVGDDMVSLLIKEGEDYNTIPATLTYSDKVVTLTCEPLLADEEYKIVISEGIETTSNITSTAAYEINFFTDEGSIVAELDKNIHDVIEGSFSVTYKNDFSDEEDFIPLEGEMGEVKGLTIVRTDDDIEGDGYLTVIPKRSTNAFKLSYGTYVNAGDYVRVSFDYKAPNLDGGAEIQFYGDSDKESGLFKMNDYCGGDEFIANEWQTYHIEIYPNVNTGAHEFKIYRGDDSEAVDTTTFSMDADNTTGLRLRFSKNKAGEENSFDNIKVETQGNEVTEKIITANVKNTTADVYKAYIIYSEYSADNEMLKTLYKFIEVPANTEDSFKMNFTAPSDDEVYRAYAYLWSFGTSVPMSELVTVK